MSKTLLTIVLCGMTWSILAAAIWGPVHGMAAWIGPIGIWIAAVIAGMLQYWDSRRSKTRRRFFGFLIAGTLFGSWLVWPGNLTDMNFPNRATQEWQRFGLLRLYAPIICAIGGALVGMIAEWACSRIRTFHSSKHLPESRKLETE